MRVLNAGLCQLEPQTAAHAHEMFSVLSDAAIYEFENAPPASEAWLLARFRRLEARIADDASERWLNWVLRLPDGQLAGYVQASVNHAGEAYIAYELASRYWRQGIGSAAVGAMLAELETHYGARHFYAQLKARNFRSLALLHHLGFAPASAKPEPACAADELLLYKAVSNRSAASPSSA